MSFTRELAVTSNKQMQLPARTPRSGQPVPQAGIIHLRAAPDLERWADWSDE